jgi:hypothetical protein
MFSIKDKINRLQQDMGALTKNCEVLLGLRGEEPHPFLSLLNP